MITSGQSLVAVKSGEKSLRIWVDITNAPHVLIFRPLLERFRSRGHSVMVTARDFSQTLSLLESHGIEYRSLGRHRGKKIAAKAYGLAARTLELLSFGRKHGFDLAVSHGSNDLAVAAFLLRVPHVTMFDYEHATVAHHINIRLSSRVVIPDLIPLASLSRFGAEGKVIRYPGLKEEYYLSDWLPDGELVAQLGLEPKQIIVVVRTPPDAALYHRFENSFFYEVLTSLAQREDVQVVLLPRTPDQRDYLRKLDFPNVIVPEEAVDAQSLIYFADVVISAGGTMNREAVCLNTPVYTLFSGRMGAIDAHLIKEGKLLRLENLDDLKLGKKLTGSMPETRDPDLLADQILEVVL